MDEQQEVTHEACLAAGAVLPQPDVNWLLQRAAHLFRDVVETEASRHGVGMRGQLVLSALSQEGGRTQLALGAALALDKTTLTTVLDKLEAAGLIRRLPEPKDRRVRIPEITDAGRELQAEVYDAIRRVTDKQLAVLDEPERKAFEQALSRLVENCPPDAGHPAGSCM